MEDDCVCDYDSTWDTESDGDDPAAGESKTRRSNLDKNKPSWALWHHTPRNLRAAKDMQNYRRGYPNLTDDECTEDKMSNLQFYLNKFPSSPDDVYIESFHKDWKNDYKRLERVHSYIQWLFPLREPGVNYMASELTKKEIEAFKKNEDAKRRLVESYELMLGFYGIRLVNKETGEVKRAENWKDRFGNLERNMHNNLRITRILKSLGELGFEHYQAPLVRFFLEETLVKKTLSSVKRSVLDYFLFAVLDRQKRQELVKFAYLHFEPKDKFVWCPRKVQKQFRKAEKSKDGDAALQHKEEGLDNITKAQKGSDKNKDKSKQPADSARPQAEDEPVRNGNVEPESNVEVVRNGNDSPDDDQDMDQSPSPDTTTQPEPDEQKSTSNSTDAIQEAEVMQTDGDVQTENPPKKKREEDEALTDHLAEHSASGQVGGGAVADKSTGQLSPSVQTPHKTSKHSPSPSSEREGKIPRTDFSQQPNPEEASEEEVSGTNGVENNRSVDEQRNRTESDDEMESSSEQNLTRS
ncbi:opioid growth factor receptor [Nematolebias whitei]|uniref:opioid growth factor receptor n=1 Tax=Nematolebias whitei TaxID=451745 RepID=UPI00189A7451|nr:opioid growth factor receptor [Nematolebias whitei]